MKKIHFFVVFMAFFTPFLFQLMPLARASGDRDFNPSNSIKIENQMCISHSPLNWPTHADNLKTLGPKICRNNIEWFRCAHTYGKTAGIFDFTYYDDLLSNSSARGIEFLGCFVYGWGWWPNNKEVPREDWPYYIDFVEAFCDRYKDNITYYEMWNEPNIGFWPGTDEDFFEFLELITVEVRSHDPTSFIFSPSPAGVDIEFMEKMINHFGDAMFNSMFDGMAYHAYSGKNAEYVHQKIVEFQDIMDRHGLTGDVWITEIGMSTNLPTQQQIDDYMDEWWLYQATQVVKIYPQTIAANISATFWYCHYDWCDVNDTEGEGRFGLMYCQYPSNYTYNYKPAGYAYICLNNLIDNAMFYPNGIHVEGPVGSNAWAYYYYTPRNTTVLVLWSQGVAGECGISIAPPSNSTIQGIEFDMIKFDYYTNTSTSKAGKNTHEFQLGNTPVILELNYTGALVEEGASIQPLTVVVTLNYEPETISFLILVPALLIVGIVLYIHKQKKSRSSGKLKEKTGVDGT
ncbi:MAG: hypothetical protein ACFFCS_02150 [Candidatus Hodarchaeota archaeon]